MKILHALFSNFSGELSPKDFVEFIKKPDPIILEIDCNDGTHTIEFLKAFPKSKVICFEPDSRARSRFEQKVCDPRAVLFPFAIGSVDGTTDFFASGGNPQSKPDPNFPVDWDLSGSIHPPLNHLREVPGVTFSKQHRVPIRRLDSIIQEIGIEVVDLIWADVQGAEIDLISGGRQTLS